MIFTLLLCAAVIAGVYLVAKHGGITQEGEMERLKRLERDAAEALGAKIV